MDINQFSITEVFEYIDASPKHGQLMNFHGHKIHMRSPKLIHFRYNGIVCVSCGMRGAFFKKEYTDGTIKLNLYGVNESGKEILLTRDHIIPKYHGGVNNIYNLQTMCNTCNNKKGHKLNIVDIFRFVFNRIKYIFFRI